MDHIYLEILPDSDYAKERELNTHDYRFFQCSQCGIYKSKHKNSGGFELYRGSKFRSSEAYEPEEEPSCNEFLMHQVMK